MKIRLKNSSNNNNNNRAVAARLLRRRQHDDIHNALESIFQIQFIQRFPSDMM